MSKFRPLAVVVPIEKIIKEAIKAVPESIYDPEFPDASHFRPGRGCHSALIRIRKEWGTSRWFLEFGIIGCFHTIDRHRLISIFKEEIDDPKFFHPTQKLFSAGRLVGGEKGGRSSPYGVVPHSVLLSALLGNIYPHKLDQEIGRIRQKHEIPIVQIIRLVPLETGRIDDQENSGEEASFNSPPVGDNRAIVVGGVKSIQRKAAFHSLVLSWHTPPTSTPQRRGDQKTPLVSPPSSGGPLAAFFNKPSSLLCAAFLIRKGAAGLTPKRIKAGGRERPSSNKNDNRVAFSTKNPIRYCKRRGLLIELGGEAVLVIGFERRLARKQGLSPVHFNDPYLIRICYARYADDLPLGIVGTVELIRGIQRRITHFPQSGPNLEVGSARSTYIAARSTVESPGTVIREVPSRATPIQFLREPEKRRRVKHRIHLTASHLRSAIHSKLEDLGRSILIQQLTKGMSGTGSLQDAVQPAETLRTAGVISPQVSVGVLRETVKHIRRRSGEISLLHSPGRSNVPSDVQQAVSRSGKSLSVWELSLYTPREALGGREAAGEGGGRWEQTGSFSSKFTIQIKAPIKKILQRLRDRGIISRRRPWPTHVACSTNVSDEDIANWFAGVAISPLSYYRCCDNPYQVRTIVDYQIRWSAISTPAHKHKSSARKIIPKYSKDSHIVNKEGGKTPAESPNSIELGKLGPESFLTSQDLNNKEHAYKTLYQ
uniref:Maturase-related protein n=1 Tax=Ginkgo biloba TaxID=3311 RepID=A0A8F4MEX2_GINBI|nr:maturase-related protein [Ginkgo biloba]